MAQTVIMPKFGQTVEESTIVKWHKAEGDVVKKGEVLFEIETDKAVLEAESFFDGTLLKVWVKEGVSVPVSSVVAYIGEPGEKVPDAPPAAAVQESGVRSQESGVRSQESGAGKQESGVRSQASDKPSEAPKPASILQPPPSAPRPSHARRSLPEGGTLDTPSRLAISPRAKALAKARAVNPANITGSGPNSRIVVRDVEAYLAANNYDALRISPAAKRLAVRERIDILTVKATGLAGRIMVEDVKRSIAERPRPLSTMRKIIAQRLTESFRDIPHFYVTTRADMTDLMAYRQELKKKGSDYKVTDFILEAVVMSLKEFPGVNSTTDGQTIRWRGSVDLGMAVGLDDGLVVPAIRHAEDLSLSELHDVVQDLAKRARDGKLMPDEMKGSSFTVSNMGMFDVDCFNAIINPGEAGILAVASTKATPVVREGKVVVRQMMAMTLSVDHRIVDGTTGAQFVNAVRAKLEDVELWKRLT